jgi:hypothetical protein
VDRNEPERDARQIPDEPLAELWAHGGTAWTARDVESLKAMLSRRRYDGARMAIEAPRECMIIGPTNRPEYLRNTTRQPAVLAGADTGIRSRSAAARPRSIGRGPLHARRWARASGWHLSCGRKRGERAAEVTCRRPLQSNPPTSRCNYRGVALTPIDWTRRAASPTACAARETRGPNQRRIVSRSSVTSRRYASLHVLLQNLLPHQRCVTMPKRPPQRSQT